MNAGPDGGQAAAINRGLSDSSGDILAWVNADDLLLPGTLACVANYFEKNPDVDVIYGNRVLIDAHGQDVGVWVTPPHGPDSLQWFDFIPQETAFWRRSIWEEVGGIDTGYAYGFDWDLFLRFHSAGAKIVRLPRFLGAFRQHDDQKTRRGYEEAQAELERIRDEFHGRTVSIGEAQGHAERLLIRTMPRHVFRRFAWHSGRRVPVPAEPLPDGRRPTNGGSPVNGAARANGHGANGTNGATPAD